MIVRRGLPKSSQVSAMFRSFPKHSPKPLQDFQAFPPKHLQAFASFVKHLQAFLHLQLTNTSPIKYIPELADQVSITDFYQDLMSVFVR